MSSASMLPSQPQGISVDQAIFAAMPPDRHRATSQTIDLEMLNQAIKDDEHELWKVQRKNLGCLFADKIGGRSERQEIRRLSVFAPAPQPLPIELGRLLNEMVPITVHNRQRELTAPSNRQRDRPVLDFLVSRPEPGKTEKIALSRGQSDRKRRLHHQGVA